MIHSETALDAALKKDLPVYCFYGSDLFFLQRAAQKALSALTEEDGPGKDAEVTRINGPTPDLGELVMAAGAISLFGTRRVILLPLLQPSGYSDKDLDALCDLLSSAENAVFILTLRFEDERALKMMPKRAERLISQCAQLGYAAQLAPPSLRDVTQLLSDRAGQTGTRLTNEAARLMQERCGQDLFLLQNELDKLAAASGYTEITPELVRQMGVQSLEADVFEMIRLLNTKNAAAACKKLRTLRRAQNDPASIAAAMISSYLDMYRVKAGQEARRPYQQVFKDFAYTGKDYRLKKSGEAAARYTKRQLAVCLRILEELDLSLKSSPLDRDILLEQAVCRLAAAGAR